MHTRSMNQQQSQCVFCRIICGEIPARTIFETDTILVIADIAPKAPIHYLIIPKKHITDVRDLTDADRALAGDMVLMAQRLAAHHHNAACKLVVNNGHEAGQRVFHMHIHFLSGALCSESMID